MSRMAAFWEKVERLADRVLGTSPGDQASASNSTTLTQEESQSEESQSEESPYGETPSDEMQCVEPTQSVETPSEYSDYQDAESESSESEESESEDSAYQDAESEDSESEESETEDSAYQDAESDSESEETETEDSAYQDAESEDSESEESETEDSECQDAESEDSESAESETKDSESEESDTSESEDSESENQESPPLDATVEEQNTQANVDVGTKKFGSTGANFAKLKGSKTLNPRQVEIFDDKFKQAIENDPRAKAGAMSESELKALAQQAADVTNKLAETPLPKKVNQLSQKSETLKNNIVNLQNDGWTIVVGVPGGGSFCDKAAKQITMDPNDGTKEAVQGLAHETGHALYTPPADPSVADPSATVAKGREYIRKVVENNLLDEGQAQIVACATAKELEAAGETGINIPGSHSDEYKAVYEKILDGSLGMDAGRKEMAKIMASEETSNSGENYIDYYSSAPRTDWNNAHAGAQVPVTPRVAVFP